MLGKLLKYDLKYVFGGMIGVYIVSLIFALLTRVCGIFDGSAIMGAIANVTGVMTIILLIAVVLLNIVRVWTRFLKNVYGDESYLTQTLPVGKSVVYTAKFLTAVISMFVSMMTVLVAVFIAWYSENGMERIKQSITGIADVYDSSVSGLLIVFFMILFLQETFVIQCGYTGAIIGFKADNHKIEKTVAIGIISYLVTGFTAILIMFVCALFNDGLMNLFRTNEVQNIKIFKQIMSGVGIYYLVVLCLFYFINVRLFKKGVNVV